MCNFRGISEHVSCAAPQSAVFLDKSFSPHYPARPPSLNLLFSSSCSSYVFIFSGAERRPQNRGTNCSWPVIQCYQYLTVQYLTVRNCWSQYSTVQYSTVHTVQYSTELPAILPSLVTFLAHKFHCTGGLHFGPGSL